MFTTRIAWVVSLVAASACCALTLHALQAQPPAIARQAKELVERAPLNPKLPTIFIVGDSTADFHDDPAHEGVAGAQGWGIFLQHFFDPQRVNVVNAARSGRSSRTYLTEGHWKDVAAMLKPKDIVLIQLGQNDVFPINDTTRARGTLPGVGAEVQEIENGVTHQHETVHTYGWYIQQIVSQTKAHGAQAIVLSLTPRNVWKDGQVEVGVGEYRSWAREIAGQEKVDFVDVSAIMALQYQKLGQEKVAGLYHAKEPVHMTTPGAYLSAQLIVSGLKSLLDAPVSRYLSPSGQMLMPSEETSFHWPLNSKQPTLWILGDSTVRNGDGTGVGRMWGWGDALAEDLHTAPLNVANVAVSGRSSRTYYTADWPLVLPNIHSGDFVLMQFGHNDAGDPADPGRSRASLPGAGTERRTIQNPLTGQPEEVHTYGWYVRQFISETRKAGATPIVCAAVPRNQWDGDKVKRAEPVRWAEDVARDEQVPFLDINKGLAAIYEGLGRYRTTALFADGGTHTTREGAELAAQQVLKLLVSLGPPSLRIRLTFTPPTAGTNEHGDDSHALWR